MFENAAAGEGVLLVLLLAAFGWGALHALSPGHGKAMVAAYLVGTRGKPRHAVALGATVTVTHTIGVFALGVVTLALSQYILPEDLYPWLNLLSGLLVVVIGAGVLRSRARLASTAIPSPSPRSRHDPATITTTAIARHHGPTVTKRSLIGMGAAAGLIPCPSALVVLLAAISQHEIGARNAPDHGFQRRAGGHAHRARPGRGLRAHAPAAARAGSRSLAPAACVGWPRRCPRRRRS